MSLIDALHPTISPNAASGPLVLVSAPGNEGGAGGVFAVSASGCELLDPLATSGMAVAPDGAKLARLSWIRGQEEGCELLISDHFGLLTYRRLDDVGEPHSLLWVGESLYAVSTHSNCVVEMDEAGRERRTLRPEGAPRSGDCWHMNSITANDGRLLVSAFGAHDNVRGWNEPGAMQGAGIVLDIARSEVVLAGFDAPHDPTWDGDGWLICNSLTRELWRLDASGRRIRSVELGGWTRGLLVSTDVVFVGVSAHRLTPAATRAYVAVLDRSTLTEIEQLELPTRDVFSICRYSEDLAKGLRAGARRGALRNLGSPAILMDDPLQEADSIARVELASMTSQSLKIVVTNLASVIMSSLGRHPVRVGARWWDSERATWVDIVRADLPEPLYPHATATLELAMPSWPPAGVAVRICVLQEMVRWFDEVHAEGFVEITQRREPDDAAR